MMFWMSLFCILCLSVFSPGPDDVYFFCHARGYDNEGSKFQ